MRHTILIGAGLCVIALTTVVACKKPAKSNSTAPVTIPAISLNQLFAGLRSVPQNIIINAGRDTVVLGASETVLHFYTNSFKDVTGATITSGTINLQLVEMYKPGDFICNRATTTLADGQILQSGGEINLSATMNGAAVYANKYGIGFKQYSPFYQPMALFYGNTNNGDSVVTWTISDTTKQENVAGAISTIVAGHGHPSLGYVFDSASSLLYINCDFFYHNDSPKTSVTVVVPDTSFNPSNTQIYLVLPTINCAMSTVQGVLGGYGWNEAAHTIMLVSESLTNIVPIGMSYELVVMANKGGNYYYYETSGTTTSGMTISATMAPETQADIKAQLAGL